ncbi:Acg family FMN-binding oxidoreductase [Pseudonocardia humida]|uniref:NAD(P)H nitroreductase n=1 Tax=Pseudonocardia humida TaxID=2800819 RepID=A0ABT1A009_9PSEU|nr:NAD(P)H nitroreductase [Pseudonocardia humida]MCO1656337.1 NAD(P)H nitroreductase [Pseudonocardia humida]
MDVQPRTTGSGGPDDRADAAAGDPVAAVELALRAPSVHNTQPWRWRIGPDEVQLHADRFRHLAATDPDRRDLLISCGAALHHLRAALAGAGVAERVALLPDPANRLHLATVRAVTGPPDPALVRMASSITRRRTDRRRLSHRPVPAELRDALVRRAGAEGPLLVPVVAAARRELLLATLAEASSLQRHHPGYAAELQRWTHRPAHTHDGVPAENVPPPPIGASVPAPQRPFGPAGLARSPARPGRDPDEDDGALFLVLVTAGDTERDRMLAGQAASAVLLTATGMGLATTPFSQAVEVGASRLRLRRDVLGIPEHPQLVIRVGWPAPGADPLPASPRRPFTAVRLPTG